MGGKKNFGTSVLVILLVITVIALLDNARSADSVSKLEEDNRRLEIKVARLEEEAGNRLRMADDLKNENDTLAVNLSNLEEEMAAAQSSVSYQDFLDAIEVVEGYKAAGNIEEAMEFIMLQNFIGYGTFDGAGNCPCTITFKYRNHEWNPGVVLDLSEFNIEKGKIVLTFLTVDDLENNYQFVMSKGEGFYDMTEKWRIEEIRLKGKEEKAL
ncbi:hypothetical protein J7E38_15620 [Bacillus sp. ISL-35]|uniref:hypothetical protein n=1 Tax=Bacillus sp. ISL-35 TaxID=2819122 RepID=UPI001BEB6BAE|nr:hypothetical protein [Bacillus sp. ISL-35]MBT2680439.1 hypothetical protein [Bacillus sp. ISL-35]MBT2704268.1 hypothetical protein [Chryseobacterium sp. ISL-80]